MSVTLPSLPRGASVAPRLIDFGATLRPPLGGPVQRIGRLGSRFAVDVRLPPLSLTDARSFLARQIKAKTTGETLKLAWPQAQAAPAIGAPLVNGAGQTGSLLAVDGLTAGVTVPEGAFFSFTAGGRAYLHVVTAAVVASGGGAATLSIGPMLRATPADNVALNFAAPEVEGLLGDGDVAWDLDSLRIYGVAFTLAEAR